MKNNFRDTIIEVLEGVYKHGWKRSNETFNLDKDEQTIADGSDKIIKAFKELVEGCEPKQLEPEYSEHIRLGHTMACEEYKQNLTTVII